MKIIKKYIMNEDDITAAVVQYIASEYEFRDDNIVTEIGFADSNGETVDKAKVLDGEQLKAQVVCTVVCND